MESSRDDKLAATLSALRPAPRPAFAAELDERAAAGFPRPTAGLPSPLSRAIGRIGALTPRRAFLPACATALAALAIATVVVATNESGGGASEQMAVAPPRAGSDPSGSTLNRSAESSRGAAPAAGPEASSAASATRGSADLQFGEEPSVAQSPSNSYDSNASGAPHRDVERSAEMVLGADPAAVSDDAAKVFAAVHSTGGIVLNSSVHDGSGESAPGADFELLIPSARLGDALGAFSQIAEVRYRREATNDITAPTVGVSERLQDSNAKIESLLAQLAAAESDGEREAVEAELATERRHAAALRSQLTALQRRANFSRVSLHIKTGESSTPSSSGGGGWSIGDALHDAGQILAVAAGVAIVGLAVLGPLALIALLIWLTSRAWVHRSRQRALG